MRKFLFISSGILFFCIGAALIIIGAGDNDSMFISLSGASIPFLFTAFWNIYSVYYEKKTGSDNAYFIYDSPTSIGIGAFYNKAIAIPFFLVLFGSVALAITTALLAANRSTEDIAIVTLSLSFLYSLIVAVYFTRRFRREIKGVYEDANKNTNEVLGFKIAFFFASVATVGVFPLVYYIVKALKKNS